MIKAQEIHLKSRPKGMPQHTDFELKEVELIAPVAGQIAVRNDYLSVDPYMRGRMNDVKSYVPPFALNQVMDGGAVGTVVQSCHPEFKEGDPVLSFNGWRTHWVKEPEGVLNLSALGDLPKSWALGVLGMPGLTAWAGLFCVADLKPKETVFVSGAAGAVGSLAGQIAKAQGCRVIGSAGSPEKLQLLKQMGFDEVINYKTDDLLRSLSAYAPSGVDVYFDNVGGSHLEAAINVMKPLGRIAMCGAIEAYNDEKPVPGPSNLIQVVGKRLRLQGFIVTDYQDKQDQFIQEMSALLREDKILVKETSFAGIEQMVDGFLGLFSGRNIGKAIVKL